MFSPLLELMEPSGKEGRGEMEGQFHLSLVIRVLTCDFYLRVERKRQNGNCQKEKK